MNHIKIIILLVAFSFSVKCTLGQGPCSPPSATFNAGASNPAQTTLSVCADGSNTITFSVPGGIADNSVIWQYSASNAPFNWVQLTFSPDGSQFKNVATFSNVLPGYYRYQSGLSACGATPSNPVTITGVSGLPSTPTLTASNSTVCPLSPVTFYNTTDNGTFSSKIYLQPGILSNVTVTSDGTYYAINQNVCGFSPQSNLVILTLGVPPSAPTITLPTLPLCNGASGTLTASGDASDTYTWYKDGVEIVGETGQTLSVSSAATYTVTETAACGTSVASAGAVVTVSTTPTAPTITSLVNFTCDNSSILLTASGTGGNTFKWYKGGSLVQNSTSQTYSASSSGDYTVTETNSCPASLASAAKTLKIGNAPTATIYTNGIGFGATSVGIVANPTGGSSPYVYSWSTGATTQQISINSDLTADYTLTVTDDVGCTVTSVFHVTTTPAGNITSSLGNTFCPSQSTTLTAPAGDLYIWGTGFISQTITTSLAGNYKVLVQKNNTQTLSQYNITLSLYPNPTVNALSSLRYCNGSATALISFSGSVGGTTYAWTNDNTAIGIGAFGNGNIASTTATNSGSSPIGGNFVVTPSANGCTGSTTSFSVFVNPTATVNAISSQVVCNGSMVTGISFGSSNTGGVNTYAWTNNTTSIGLAASGSGNIISFGGSNVGTAPVTATVIATPTFTNGGVSCSGSTQSFNITINPSATVNAISNQVVCNGAAVSAINFGTSNTGGVNTYAWTNNATSIGLGASGSGNIVSFNGANIGTAPLTATVIATPTFTNGGVSCSGSTQSFNITVNPTATVNAISSQVVCNGAAVTVVTFGTTNTGGVNTYAWTNNTTSIGLAASGSGNIASFNGVNIGTAPVTATVIATPTFTNGGVSCSGSTQSFNLTVNPSATVNAISSQVVCNTFSVTAVNFGTSNTGGVNTYAWTNNTTSIGLAASGSGNIASFNGINIGTAPVTATVIATPTFTNGGVSCGGSTQSFNITINPTATLNSITNQVVCNGSSVSVVTFGTTNTGGVNTYAWTNNTTSVGLAASGSGNIGSFNGINIGTAPVTATVIATPTFTNGGVSCLGSTKSFSITINPTATVNAISSQVVCNTFSVTAINFSTTNTGGVNTYAWTNNTTSIGLAASGSGNIGSFNGINIGIAPVTATVIATPTFTNGGVSCSGSTQSFNISINPTATVNAIISQVVCNGASVSMVNFGTSNTGGVNTYDWTNNITSIGLGASGSGDIVSFNGINIGTAPVTATVIATPTFTNGGVSCLGSTKSFSITVNPTATVNAISSKVVCNGAIVSSITFGTTNTGGVNTYAWTNNTTSIGLAATGSGNIVSFSGVNTGTVPVTATVIATPTFTNGGVSCLGSTQSFNITINPTATVDAIGSQVVCNGAIVSGVTFSSSNIGGVNTYSWTNNTTSIGLAASGSGNIVSFSGVNIGTAPVTANLIATPFFTNSGVTCSGSTKSFSITVNPTATVNATSSQVVCNTFPVTAINFGTSNTGGLNTYAWTNNTTSIGLAASGSGNIATFIGSNNDIEPVTATVIATPTFTSAGVSCGGNGLSFSITINPTPKLSSVLTASPVCDSSLFSYQSTSLTSGTSFTWSRGVVSGISNPLSNGNSASINEYLKNTTVDSVVVNYKIGLMANSCSNNQNVTVIVRPSNRLSSFVTQKICDSSLFTYTAQSSVAGKYSPSFSWTRAAVPGISNSVGSGNTSQINEILKNNTTDSAIARYAINMVSATGCSFTDSLYLTVRPTNRLSSAYAQAICDSTLFTYMAKSNVAAKYAPSFSWVRTEVTGISNAFATGNNASISETLKNNTTDSLVARYAIKMLSATGCSFTDSLYLTVRPTNRLSSPYTQIVCDSSLFTYTAKSNVAAKYAPSFSWTRAAVPGISNPAGSGNINPISEILVDTANKIVQVNYAIKMLSATGCFYTDTLVTAVINRPFGNIITMPTDTVATGQPLVMGLKTTDSLPMKYSWKFGDGSSANTQLVSIKHYYYTPTIINPSISVTATNSYGCFYSFFKPIVVLADSVKKTPDTIAVQRHYAMLIYPVPFKTFLRLQYTNNGPDEEALIRANDMAGNNIYVKRIILLKGDHTIDLPIDQVQKGFV